MNTWLDWGIPLIRWFQGFGEWIAAPMDFFSALGRENFFLLVMPVIVWSVDVVLGFKLGLLLLFSNSLNAILKWVFGWPRPYWISKDVLAWSSETSFGMPSGHSQTAVAFWGRMVVAARQRWLQIGLLLLILLISISRMVLGMHYPADVLVGWVVGSLLLWSFVRLEERLRRLLADRSAWVVIGLAFLVSLLLIGLGLLSAQLPGETPQAWITQAAAARPEAEPIHPVEIDGLISSSGTIFGLIAGGYLLFKRGGFNAGGIWWKRLLRYLVGLIGVVIIYFGLRQVFPEGVQALRYLRYAAVGFWVMFLAPMTFIKLRING